MSSTPINQLPTTGGGVVEVRGVDFGPLTTPVLYSSLYFSTVSQLTLLPSCTMTEPHVALQCTVLPGYGRLVMDSICQLRPSHGVPLSGVGRGRVLVVYCGG
jgi:hypothetical protein